MPNERILPAVVSSDPTIRDRMDEQRRALHAPRMVEAFEHFAGSAASATPGGCTGWRGTLLHIHIAEAASYEMEELNEAYCVAGRGIEGDRYFTGRGIYSKKADVREVTLIEQEVLDALARNDPPLQGGPVKLRAQDHRRNLTVRGVPLNHLVGRRFRVGAVILRGGRLNFPCKYLEKLLGLPVYLPLYNRSGLNCSMSGAAPFGRATRSNFLIDPRYRLWRHRDSIQCCLPPLRRGEARTNLD